MWQRKKILRVAGLASLGLPGLMQLKEAAARSGNPSRDTRVILIWLDGGPSHMDLYDLKPNAPAEYRGLWRPIRTNVGGMQISELFPKQAKVADKFSIVRSIWHNDVDHFGGAHRMLTSRAGASGADTTGKYPSIGSIATRVTGAGVTGALDGIPRSEPFRAAEYTMQRIGREWRRNPKMPPISEEA